MAESQKNTNNTKSQKKQSDERKRPSFGERLENKQKVIAEKIAADPIHTRLVTTELSESYALSMAIEEIEEGAKALKLAMGSPKISFENAIVLLNHLSWAKDQVVGAVNNINIAGFGKRNTLYELRENTFKERKRLVALSEGTDTQKALADEFETLMAKRSEEDVALIAKRIKEDAALAVKRAKEDESIQARIKDEEAKATEERRQKKEKEKAERKAAHEKRMKEQQEAKVAKEKEKKKELQQAEKKAETPKEEKKSA